MNAWLTSIRDTNEPVRRAGVIAGAVLAVITVVGGFLLAWGSGTDWRIALGVALLGGTATGAGPIVAAELGRRQAYGPSTVAEILDADAVITAAERR